MIRICILLSFLLALRPTAFSQTQDQTQWTLEECIAYAFEHNLTIRRSELDVKTGSVNLNESRYLRYPTLNADGYSGYRWGRSIDPTSNQFVSRRISSTGFSGSGSLTLFSGLQINNQIQRNKAALEASRYELEDTRNNVALDVVSFYLIVIFNRELVKNAERQLQVADIQLEQTRKMVEAGAAPISSQLELEAQKASYEVEVVRAQNELDLALLNLKQALLIPAEREFQVETPEIRVEDMDISTYGSLEVYENALQNQPIIKSAHFRQRSAALGVRIARGSLAPSLGLSANIFTNYSDAAPGPVIPNGEVTEIVQPIGYVGNDRTVVVNTIVRRPAIDENYTLFEQFGDNLSQSLSLNLSIPIFNGFRARSNIQRALIALDETEIYSEETRQRLRQTIESAYNDAFAASKSYHASLKQVEALEESFRSIQRRYTLGAESFVNFQVSQNNLFDAQYELLRSKYEYVYRIKILDFYMGKPLRL